MLTGNEYKDYWVLRLAQAVDDALDAPSERTRIAYLELARHYWSMHVMVNGAHKFPELNRQGGSPASRPSTEYAA